MTVNALRNRPLVAFLALALLETFLMAVIDRPLAQAVNGIVPNHPILSAVFKTISSAGESLWYQAPSGVGVFVCLFLYYVPPFPDDRRKKILVTAQNLTFFFFSTASAELLVNLMKTIVGRARPNLLLTDGIYGFHPMTLHPDWNAMPSAHAATIFSVAASLGVLFPRIRCLLFASAFIVAISDVALEFHYLSDVILGAVTGWLVTKISKNFFTSRDLLPRRTPTT